MSDLGLEYEAIVSRYICECRPYAKKENLHFQRMATLSEAISFASRSLLPTGNRHPHQYRIPAEALEKARERLLETDLTAASSFDELHHLIKSEISDIYNIGPLAIYDISQRIGIFLRIEPEHIYFHCGTSIGAKALGLDVKQIKARKEDLPLPFQKLTANELEDCLCIFQAELVQLSANSPVEENRSKVYVSSPTQFRNRCSLPRRYIKE